MTVEPRPRLLAPRRLPTPLRPPRARFIAEMVAGLVIYLLRERFFPPPLLTSFANALFDPSTVFAPISAACRFHPLIFLKILIQVFLKILLRIQQSALSI